MREDSSTSSTVSSEYALNNENLISRLFNQRLEKFSNLTVSPSNTKVTTPDLRPACVNLFCMQSKNVNKHEFVNYTAFDATIFFYSFLT